jgi:hypothetical protein
LRWRRGWRGRVLPTPPGPVMERRRVPPLARSSVAAASSRSRSTRGVRGTGMPVIFGVARAAVAVGLAAGGAGGREGAAAGSRPPGGTRRSRSCVLPSIERWLRADEGRGV